jgi:hypoxanthine phosphoribosyltransferase
VSKIFIDWDILEQARVEFEKMKLPIDAVVGIACGGLPVATLAKHVFDKPLYLVEASSYTEKHKRKALKFRNLSVPKSIKGKKILLVDDVWDSGTTMKFVTKWLEGEMKAQVYPYVLFSKGVPKVQHGVMFMNLCRAEDWLIFPWEID